MMEGWGGRGWDEGEGEDKDNDMIMRRAISIDTIVWKEGL